MNGMQRVGELREREPQSGFIELNGRVTAAPRATI